MRLLYRTTCFQSNFLTSTPKLYYHQSYSGHCNSVQQSKPLVVNPVLCFPRCTRPTWHVGLGCSATSFIHCWLPLSSMCLRLGFDLASITLAKGAATAPNLPEKTNISSTVGPRWHSARWDTGSAFLISSWKCHVPQLRSTRALLFCGADLDHGETQRKKLLDNFLIFPFVPIPQHNNSLSLKKDHQ